MKKIILNDNLYISFIYINEHNYDKDNNYVPLIYKIYGKFKNETFSFNILTKNVNNNIIKIDNLSIINFNNELNNILLKKEIFNKILFYCEQHWINGIGQIEKLNYLGK